MGQVIDISQSAINSQNSGGGSRLVASLLNVNLKTVAPNVLAYIDGVDSSKVANPCFAMKHVSGTYVQKIIPLVPTSTTIVFDDTKFPDSAGVSPNNPTFNIRIFIGAIEIFTNGAYAGVVDNDAWMGFVEAKFIIAGYTVVRDGLNMEIISSTNTEDGMVIEVSSRGFDAGSFTSSLSSSPAFSGGSNQLETDIKLKQGVTDMQINGAQLIDLLNNNAPDSTFKLSDKITTQGIGLVLNAGNYSLPVAVGTEEDYVVDLLIFADTIQ